MVPPITYLASASKLINVPTTKTPSITDRVLALLLTSKINR